MSLDTANSPRVDITIQGLQFSVPQPFAEGYTLRANDANALNQTYAENLRNNFATEVKKAIADATDEAPVDLTALQAALDEYELNYDFGVRRAGGSLPADPVAREALKLAEEAVKASLRKQQYKLTDVGAAKIRELAENAVKEHPAFTERAKEIVAVKQSVALDINIGE